MLIVELHQTVWPDRILCAVKGIRLSCLLLHFSDSLEKVVGIPLPIQERNPTDNLTVVSSSSLLSFTSAMAIKSTVPDTFASNAHHCLSAANTICRLPVYFLGFCKS